MYKESFFITKPIGNNAFSFDKRINKKLYVPKLKKINTFSEIKLGKEIVFEDFDFNGELQSCTGLENFYELEWNNKKVYFFDNHNHAFYFWYLARDRGLIGDNNTLYHIDEHSDMRVPLKYLSKADSRDLRKVFNFTNFELNVGNYIIPAQKERIIGEVIQIRNEENLIRIKNEEKQVGKKEGTILNLDLDFFGPELDFISFELKKEVILNIAKKADIITIATSPFFINQQLAIKVFNDVFKE